MIRNTGAKFFHVLSAPDVSPLVVVYNVDKLLLKFMNTPCKWLIYVIAHVPLFVVVIHMLKHYSGSFLHFEMSFDKDHRLGREGAMMKNVRASSGRS